MNYLVLKRFVEFARGLVPAKHQRPFKADLVTWVNSLSEDEQKKLAEKLLEGSIHKHKCWGPIADKMYIMFKNKEVQGGSMGGSA